MGMDAVTAADSGQISRQGYLRENYHYFHLRDTAGQELDFHFHEFDKLVILLSGRVEYLLEDSGCTLEPGDVLLVKHHTIHKALIDRSVPYERVILYIDGKYVSRAVEEAPLMECFDLADAAGRHRISTAGESRETLLGILADMEAALADGGFAAQTMRDTALVRLLIYINRLMRESAPGQAEGKPQYDGKILRALSYINEHLTDGLTVDQVAKEVFLSRYHFMRLFKAQTGSTVHAYIRQKRLLNAAKLIRNGESAARAAAESGFSDYSAFYRAFRESFGASPGALK